MVFLVRDNTHRWFRRSLADYLAEHLVLVHRRIICHRIIQKAFPQNKWSAYCGSSLKCNRSHQHHVVSKLLLVHDERGGMRSYPAVVL